MSVYTRFIRLMKIPLKSLAVVALLLSTLSVSAEYLIVNFRNGTTTSFDLNDSPDVTFSDSRMTIKYAEFEATYEVKDVDTFTFGDKRDMLNPVLGENETRLVCRDRDYIEIRGLDEGTVAMLYSVSGQMIMSVCVDDVGIAAFDISSLSGGVYILSTSTGQTFKISR